MNLFKDLTEDERSSYYEAGYASAHQFIKLGQLPAAGYNATRETFHPAWREGAASALVDHFDAIARTAAWDADELTTQED